MDTFDVVGCDQNHANLACPATYGVSAASNSDVYRRVLDALETELQIRAASRYPDQIRAC